MTEGINGEMDGEEARRVNSGEARKVDRGVCGVMGGGVL